MLHAFAGDRCLCRVFVWLGPLSPLSVIFCGVLSFKWFSLCLSVSFWTEKVSICKWMATLYGPPRDLGASPKLPHSGSSDGLLTNEVTLREVLSWMFSVTGHRGDKCELHTEQMVSKSCFWCHCFASEHVLFRLWNQIIYIIYHRLTGFKLSVNCPLSPVTTQLIVTKYRCLYV